MAAADSSVEIAVARTTEGEDPLCGGATVACDVVVEDGGLAEADGIEAARAGGLARARARRRQTLRELWRMSKGNVLGAADRGEWERLRHARTASSTRSAGKAQAAGQSMWSEATWKDCFERLVRCVVVHGAVEIMRRTSLWVSSRRRTEREGWCVCARARACGTCSS